MEYRKFYEAKSHLSEFYGIDMDDDVFETVALHAWDKINNKTFCLYLYECDVVDGRVDLPCNANIIEWVQGNGESVGTPSAVSDYAAYNKSSFVEETLEDFKGIKGSPYYGRGHFLQYQQIENFLFFKGDVGRVRILYKGVIADEEGLPSLNYKEIEAIAKYCAFIDNQKKAMMTKDRATMEIAQMMNAEWRVACANARTPVYINQNDMDRILDIQTSWDRKRFGQSFKILR